jgi:hypothetical protein
MKFEKADEVEQTAWTMRQADYVRGQNRALINNLFNGVPPFKEERPVNVNFLEATRVAHDARAQFYSAFLRPGSYFKASTDFGPKSKVSNWSHIVTTEMNRRMKRSMNYFETFRSKFALDVLHGIGPAVWRDKDKWCPDAIGVEDVGIPANTYLTMENLPFFYSYKSFTAPELMRLTRNMKKNPGWNKPMVNSLIRTIDKESQALMGNNFPDIWSPEKVAERIKGDGGFYAYDEVPLIYVFDFYYWSDEGDVEGWRRRMVLDTFSYQTGGGKSEHVGESFKDTARGQFLYDSGSRVHADKLTELISFQFADLSAVAPFRYHSVRSLGFLMYAVCNLQNRLRCRLSEAQFEALMQFYRVKNAEDADRALYLNMIDKGFIDESIQFVPAEERWQVNAQLIELGINQNQDLIERGSSGYFQPMNNEGKTQKTKFQVMAEIQASTALVSSAFNQAYAYQEAEYREIFRRFCKANSTDSDVREFRAACLRQGVPESQLCPEYWDIAPSRVMGAGNKTLEMAISEQLLQMRPLFDPEPQREILRDVVFGITDDSARAERLVPVEPLKISDSVHDAQLAAGVLMQGLPVAVKTGQNHAEYVQVMIMTMQSIIQKAQQAGGMADAKTIEGLNNMARHVNEHLKILAEDKTMKSVVAEYSKQLSKLMNFVKAFEQRLQQAMKKQQEAAQQQNGHDPAAQAKLQATVAQAKVKQQITRESHAERTAQKGVAFKQKLQQDRERFEMEQQMKLAEAGSNILQEHVRTAHEIQQERLKSANEGSDEE